MLKHVRPYRSARTWRRGGVHHDRSDCPTGRLIPSKRLAVGSGGLPLCAECQALARRDVRLPDRPRPAPVREPSAAPVPVPAPAPVPVMVPAQPEAQPEVRRAARARRAEPPAVAADAQAATPPEQPAPPTGRLIKEALKGPYPV